VVVHGERDCVNSFIYHHMAAAHRFFSTHVTEEQATLGQVDGPLRQCLRLVLDELRPTAVLVLGSCLMTMIGTDPQRVVDEVVNEARSARDHGDDALLWVRYLPTSGLRLGSQAEMADWLYATLAGLPQHPVPTRGWPHRLLEGLERVARQLEPVVETAAAPAAPRALEGPEDSPQGAGASLPRAGETRARTGGTPPDPVSLISSLQAAVEATDPAPPPSCNLLGLPRRQADRSELAEALAAAGIRLGERLPEDASLDAWRRVSWADVTLVVDRSLYPQLVKTLEQDHGLSTLEVPLPTGLRQTRRFYQLLGDHFGVTERLTEVLSAHDARARAARERFRKRARGLRLALGLRMLNNYRADQLAYGGLGDAEALRELGFDITLLIQGPRKAAPRFEALLEAAGCALPYQIFPSPWNLAPLLAEGGYDVAYLADHSREEARKAGVPMIESRSLRPLYAGIEPNLEQLAELLRLGGRPTP
jgi:hypothetical protein